MEKIKKLMSNSKNLAILGLIGGIMLFPIFPYSSICFILYFALIIYRLITKTNNKYANFILQILAYAILLSNAYETIYNTVTGSFYIIIIYAYIIYFINMFLFFELCIKDKYKYKNKNRVIKIFTNNVAFYISLIVIILSMIVLKKSIFPLGYLFIAPYLYNHRNLLRKVLLKEDIKND